MYTIKVSPGEMFDRISILEIKKMYAQNDPKKLEHIEKELEIVRAEAPFAGPAKKLIDQLHYINHNIWVSEEGLRHLEKFKNFGKLFVELARQAYINNDERFSLKKQINEVYETETLEEKIYGV